MDNSRKRRVLLLYRVMIPSVRLCGHCQMEELAKQGLLEYRACQELKVKSSDLNWADIVLLGRLDSWYEYQLTKKLKKAGKYLIYIIDDDLLNIPKEISSAAYYAQEEIQGYIRGMIEMSDAILSPSTILLEKYAVNGRKAIQIEEPAIDPVSYEPHDPNKPVKIGFAGSIDRTGDIESILRNVLIQIKREFGDHVQFEFFGALPSFADDIDAKCIPYCDSYDEYRKTLNGLEWDIGLAPMPDTPFHACKHYNKFIEYAAAGIVGVYSDVQPYCGIRKIFGYDRFCTDDEFEWYRELKELIEDRQKRENSRELVITIARQYLSVDTIAKSLMKFIYCNDVKSKDKRKINAISIYILKNTGLFARVYLFGKKYKHNAPKVIFQKVIEKTF